MACELYRCLLPQCEALRICRSGFPIATEYLASCVYTKSSHLILSALTEGCPWSWPLINLIKHNFNLLIRIGGGVHLVQLLLVPLTSLLGNAKWKGSLRGNHEWMQHAHWMHVNMLELTAMWIYCIEFMRILQCASIFASQTIKIVLRKAQPPSPFYG